MQGSIILKSARREVFVSTVTVSRLCGEALVCGLQPNHMGSLGESDYSHNQEKLLSIRIDSLLNILVYATRGNLYSEIISGPQRMRS